MSTGQALPTLVLWLCQKFKFVLLFNIMYVLHLLLFFFHHCLRKKCLTGIWRLEIPLISVYSHHFLCWPLCCSVDTIVFVIHCFSVNFTPSLRLISWVHFLSISPCFCLFFLGCRAFFLSLCPEGFQFALKSYCVSEIKTLNNKIAPDAYPNMWVGALFWYLSAFTRYSHSSSK